MIPLPSPIPADPAWFPLNTRPDPGAQLTARWSRDERKVLRRKKAMQPSAWVERHIVLPEDSPVPGPYRISMVPYAGGVMDASFFPGVEEIVMCWPSQTSKTTIVNNCLAYATDRAPGNAIVVYPDEITAKDNAKDRLQTMINASPLLRGYKTNKADDEGALKIKLRHMIIYMAWANSAARLANRPAPYGVADEEDKYPVTVGKKESGPIDLLRNRSRTFGHMRKLWRVSTPTIETGPIWRALTEECELVFVFHVRCPLCGVTQLMEMGDGKEDRGIKWPGGSKADPEEIQTRKLAYYVCEKCHGHWSDAERNMAVRMGEWRDQKTGMALMACMRSVKPRVIGFHLRSWLSPFVSISEVAAAFLRGLKDKTKLKKYKNDHEAEPWRAIRSDRSEDRILDLADDRPRGIVPGGGVVACLLAGVDTQDDGFYYEIRAFGWGMEKESWCVQEGKVPTFAALAQVLWENEYKDTDGNVYHVHLVMQDSAGHRTSEVYDFCRMHRGRVFPTKGMQTMSTPYTFRRIDHTPSGKPIPGGVRLFRIDTNYYKNMLAGMLEIAPGDPGCWWYHKDVTLDWARQMSAEGIDEKGLWVNSRNRANHAWDCAVLLLMAHDFLNVATRRRPTPGGKAAKKQQKPAAQRIKLW